MATNIEVKARVSDLEALRRRAETVGDTQAELIYQEDIFFRAEEGRLKLRILAADRGQLIYYQRADQSGPKRSDYFISETAEPEKLKNVLNLALGIRGIVRKRRWLYWVDRTRIHLDDVEGLGPFMELEVMLEEDQSEDEGRRIAAELMAALDIDDKDLIEKAYIDLLDDQEAGAT